MKKARHIVLVVLGCMVGLAGQPAPQASGEATSPITQTSQQGRIDAEVVVDGVTRQFIIYVPPGYTDQTAVSLVFMFHGTGGDGERFYKISGWKEKADEENLIAVFPSARRYCFYDDGRQRRATKWVAEGFLRTACEGQSFNDDVKFVRLMVDYIQQRYTVEATRIYASGFSNGAAFVNTRLVLEATDLFAAVATVGGLYPEPFEVQGEIISSYMVTGELDDNQLEQNGGQPLPLTEAALAADDFLQPRIEHTLATFQLTNAYEAREAPQHLTLRFTNSLAGNDNEWRFSIIKGLTHKYPNGRNNPARVRIVDHFWPFFEAHPKRAIHDG